MKYQDLTSKQKQMLKNAAHQLGYLFVKTILDLHMTKKLQCGIMMRVKTWWICLTHNINIQSINYRC